MVLDGFYAVFYTGRVSSGYAVLVIHKGVIAGADVSGGLYDGSFVLHAEKGIIEGKLRLTIPPGVGLVTGASATQQVSTQEFPFTLPSDLNEKVVPIQTPTGPVNLKFKKIRDL